MDQNLLADSANVITGKLTTQDHGMIVATSFKIENQVPYVIRANAAAYTESGKW
jgi:hypothetical protein